MTEPQTLQRDVPCAGCGYDLRGLTPPGRCPECGFDVDESVRAADFALAAALPQARWVRQMTEAVAIGLSPFAVSMIANAWFADRARGAPGPTAYVVATTVVVWAASSWSAWRIATLEPLERRRRGRRLVAVLLRASATAFLGLAACRMWPSARDFGSEYWGFGVGLFATVAAVTFYLRVRHVAIRIGAAGLGGQALMIAVLIPSILVPAAGIGSEGLFSVTPTTGWARILRYLLRGLMRWDDWDEWDDVLQLVSWPVLLTICQVAVLVQLLVALIRTRRRAREGS